MSTQDVVHGQDPSASVSGVGDSPHGLGGEKLQAFIQPELGERSSPIRQLPRMDRCWPAAGWLIGKATVRIWS